MMQKIEWRLVENYCDAELFNSALDAIEKSELEINLKQDDTGKYSLSYLGQSVLDETIIEFGSKYVKKYHCSCDHPKKDICIHLIQAIILYRRLQIETELESEKNRTFVNLPSRVSIPAILHQIPKDELDRFIQRYARTDKKFGQALKLHFASRIQVNSPEQKYADLIKSMTRLIPLANGKIPKQSIQSLYWISEELLLQVDDLIAMETPIEAFAICYELIVKFQSIYRKLDMYLGDYEKYWIQIHQKLRTIFDLNIAPDVKQNQLQKLFDLFSDGAHPFLHSPHNLFEILYPILTPSDKALLQELMFKKIVRKEMNPIPLVAWIKQAIKLKDEQMLHRVFVAGADFAKWASAIDFLANSQKDIAKEIAQWLIIQTKDENQRYKLMERIWSLFPDESDSIVYALSLLTYSPDDKYIRYLTSKQISDEMIILALEESKHPKAIPLAISFNLENEHPEDAKKILESHLQLDLLKTFTARMYPREAEWLESMYKILISAYLDNHVGPVPAARIQNILSYLQLIKARGLTDNLYKWIKKTYQDHVSLIEALG